MRNQDLPHKLEMSRSHNLNVETYNTIHAVFASPLIQAKYLILCLLGTSEETSSSGCNKTSLLTLSSVSGDG